jgi:predicted enzyme related to lactoylglutathione lyase
MSDTHGRFIWYELMTPDVARAKAFYGKLVGWNAQEMPSPGGGGPPYTVVDVDGAGVGGMMPMMPDVPAPNWTGYVAVDDVDASASRVAGLGGSVMHAPTDIPGIGRFAIIGDTAGAAIAIMTPVPPEGGRQPPPAGAKGTIGWHELYGADPAQGFDFYGQLFGWRKQDAHDMGPMGVYQLFGNQDGRIGGMMKRPDNIPAPCWLYYVQAGDIGAAAGLVKAGGGQVVNGPMEVPGGDWVLQAFDPQGAMFALVGVKGSA